MAEDGINGYVWSVSTPCIRYFEYHHSRGGEVVKELIGKDFGGVLGSDFYAGYNSHDGFINGVGCMIYAMPMSSKRSIRTMSTSSSGLPPSKPSMTQPSPGLSRVLTHTSHDVSNTRLAWHTSMLFEQQLLEVCRPYVGTTRLNVLYVNVLSAFYLNSFVFVAVPGVPAHNNLAERSVRPLVIARKISGEPAARKAPRPAWDSPVSLAPGWHSTLILSINVWLPSS